MKKFKLLARIDLSKPQGRHFHSVVDSVYNKLFIEIQRKNHTKAIWRFVEPTVYRFFKEFDKDE